MSCHDIGRGMNAVAKTVLDMYEEGQISKESAIRLALACRMGVHWCDGNENEAIDEIVARGYCGLCFEKSDALADIYENDLCYHEKCKVFDAYDKTAAHYWLCPKCRSRVIEEFQAGKKRNDE